MRIERRLKPNDRGRECQDEAFGLVSWAEEGRRRALRMRARAHITPAVRRGRLGKRTPLREGRVAAGVGRLSVTAVSSCTREVCRIQAGAHLLHLCAPPPPDVFHVGARRGSR